MTARMFVKVTVREWGFHRWPDAPQHRAYLRDLHRHEFKITVAMEVTRADRDVEFHDLLGAVKYIIGKEWPTLTFSGDTAKNFADASCETIGLCIGEQVQRYYGPRAVTVEVMEDESVGGVVQLPAI